MDLIMSVPEFTYLLLVKYGETSYNILQYELDKK